MVIGISGRIGSGKDTVGKIIQYLTSDYYYPGYSFDRFFSFYLILFCIFVLR
jgi:dephospho-CoA kinase